jgi:hypothetical protein
VGLRAGVLQIRHASSSICATAAKEGFLNRFLILLCDRLPVGVINAALHPATSFMVDVPSVILAQFHSRVRNSHADRVQFCAASTPNFSIDVRQLVDQLGG